MKHLCVLLRRTKVADHVTNLPRPKLTQEVIVVGTSEECHNKLDQIWFDKRNQSTEEIEVTLDVVRYTGQKNTTSARKGNGKRRRNKGNESPRVQAGRRPESLQKALGEPSGSAK